MGTDTGILTAEQREWLQSGRGGDELDRRYVREQVRNAVARDALVLWEALQPADRRWIFRSVDREPTERAASRDESSSTGEQTPVEREPTGDETIGDEPSDQSPVKSLHVDSGAAALLALFYLGLEARDADRPTGAFEAVLRNAMERVAGRNGWVLDEFAFTVSFDRDPDDEKLRRRFDAGVVTVEEATELFRRDLITSGEYAGYLQNG